MRTMKMIGTALAVLVVAALATLWRAPSVAAAGQQAGSQSQQAEKPKIEKQIVTIHKEGGGDPVVVTVESPAGQSQKVVTRRIQDGPLLAALGGGPRLGVRIRDVGNEDLATFKLSAPSGVVVEEVTKDSAAEKAGAKTGDVVVQFDGEAVRSAAQLTRLVRESVAGRAVKMGVVRDGRRLDLTVTPEAQAETIGLAIPGDKMIELEKQLKDVQEKTRQFRLERRAPQGDFTWEERVPAPSPPPGGDFRWRPKVPMPVPEGDVLQWFGDGTGNFVFSTGRGRLGVNVQELGPDLATYFGVKDGLLVNRVQADTPAARAGIKAGDVICSVDGKAVVTPAELIKELADKEGEVTIGVTRDKKPLALKATLEPRKVPTRRVPAVGRPA